jgi:hypothetical protein
MGPFVIVGSAHPYHENSISWVVDCFNEESKAESVYEALIASLPSELENLKRLYPSLTDDEKSTLLSVHYRALPVGTPFGKEYVVEYNLFDVNGLCVATGELF